MIFLCGSVADCVQLCERQQLHYTEDADPAADPSGEPRRSLQRQHVRFDHCRNPLRRSLRRCSFRRQLAGSSPFPFTQGRNTAGGSQGRLAALHLPGGPVDLPARWAATSNVEVGPTTSPVNSRRAEMERREWSEGERHKEEEREGGSGMGRGNRGPLAIGREGRT